MLNEPQDIFSSAFFTRGCSLISTCNYIVFVVFLNENGVRVSDDMNRCKFGQWGPSAPSSQTSTDFDTAF